MYNKYAVMWIVGGVQVHILESLSSQNETT